MGDQQRRIELAEDDRDTSAATSPASGEKAAINLFFGHWLLELPGTQAELEDGGSGDGGDLPMVSGVVCDVA